MVQECKYPKLIEAKGKSKKLIRVRCRKCRPCQKLRQQQWISRLLYEQAYQKYHPYFVTLTYAIEPTDPEDFKGHFTKFTKRLRDRGFSIRYFVAVEEGGKNGRLHAHIILWSELSNQEYMRTRHVLTACWKKGHVLLRRMYGGRQGFNYACKYIFKKPLWASWSRRPGLGSIGKHDFIERAIGRYQRTGRLIDRMRIPVLGKLIIVRVHSGWLRDLRKILGIKKHPDNDMLYLPGDEKPESYDEVKQRLISPLAKPSDLEDTNGKEE